MRILVTGIAGFIGITVGKRLIERGYEVIGLDKETYTEKLQFLGEQQYIQKELAKDICLPGIKSPDLIIHLAGESSVDAIDKAHGKSSLEITHSVIEIAKQCNSKKIIYLSSEKVESRKGEYAKAKLEAENLLQSEGAEKQIKYTILRCAAVFGYEMKSNIIRLLKYIKRGGVITFKNSKSTLTMIGIDDLCESIILAINNDKTDNRIYSLSDGRKYEIAEIERIAREDSETTGRSIWVPKLVVCLVAHIGNLMRLFVRNFPINTDSYKMLYQHVATIDPAFSQDTGFKAKQNFYLMIPKIMKDL